MSHWHKVSGDVDGAFESAAHVVRASHALPRLAPVPMEPRGAIASYDEADDMLTVWVSAQDSHRQLAGLAKVLDRPEESIHVIVPGRGRRVRQQGRAGAGDDARGGGGDDDRPDRSSGPRTGRRTSSRPTRGAAWRPTSSWRSTATARMLAAARPHLGRPRRLPDADHGDPHAHDRDADVRRLRHPGGRRRGRGQAHEQGADRPLPRRGAARGGLLRRVHRRRRGRASSASIRSSSAAATSSASSRTRRRSAGPTTRATTSAASTWRRSSSSPSAAPTTSAWSGTGFGMYVERAGGLFETAEAELLPDGQAPRAKRLVAARPGARHDLRAARGRAARASGSRTWSCASATRRRCRAVWAPSRAARSRWAGRRWCRRSTR